MITVLVIRRKKQQRSYNIYIFPQPGATSAEVSEMTRQMAELQTQIDQERQKGQVSSEQAEREMANTKHELLRIREMLEMAEKVRMKYNFGVEFKIKIGNRELV